MTNIIPFNYQGREVRTISNSDGPWFVAKDICEVLNIDTSQIRRLDGDDKDLRLIQTPGGIRELLCVNEPGVYSLILGSRKPEAKTFKRWIIHEVIPQIRKNGSYELKPNSIDDLIFLQTP